MAKLSDDEQKLLEQLTAKANQPDEISLWVRNESGKAIQVSGSHAQKLLKEFGLADEETGEGETGEGETGEGEKEKKPPETHAYFRR